MIVAKKVNKDTMDQAEKQIAPTYSDRYFAHDIPKFEIPQEGMPANAAYQLIHDEMNMDGRPPLNLATFVTTWMEPEARKLIENNLNKNFIDHDEYPQTQVIHQRLVNMLAELYNAAPEKNSCGTATIGSSEAIMLGLLAHKWNWKKKREEEGKSTDKPNVIFGADVHICWDKFARYFDVEPRIVPMKPGDYVLTPDKVEPLIDENTICVGAIMGTTFTGQMDDINGINDLLIKVKKEKGLDIPIHVDAASGGFISPFVHPELIWDFRLEHVKSINTSGHKFGLVYAGLGWLIFQDDADLPKELIFNVNYLGGGDMPTFTLNFSRGSAMVLAQYYNFIRLGRDGYTRIMKNCMANAQYLAQLIADDGHFDMINECKEFPIVAMKLKDDKKFTVFMLSNKLREKGWIMAAYTLPPDAESEAILRVVVKENFSRDMADMLYADMQWAMEQLENPQREPKEETPPAEQQHGKKQPIC